MRHLLIISALALAAAACAQQPGDSVVVATVYWPNHDLSAVQVRVFRDKERRDLVGAFPAVDKSGRVVMTFPPGTYYLTAIVDSNNDGKLGPDDGLGFYGVLDPNWDQPQPLEVKAQALQIDLPIVLMMTGEGRLAPTGVKLPGPPAPPTAPEPPKYITISGTLAGRADKGPAFVYLVPKQGACHVAAPDAEGRFALVCPAGEYYFFAMQDTDENERAANGDLMAVYGYDPAQGTAYPSVQLAADMPNVALALQWRIDPTGLLKAVEGEATGPQTAPDTFPAVVHGTIQWPAGATVPETLPPVIIRASSDARFTNTVASITTRGGAFALCLPQGLYFLSFYTDTDGDGKAGAGDYMGFFGVNDLRKSRGPQPLLLGPGELRPIELFVTLRLDDKAQPAPLE
ncbi:MAG: hypothetical protein ABFE08_14195 [Armatimonadia bacterium]